MAIRSFRRTTRYTRRTAELLRSNRRKGLGLRPITFLTVVPNLVGISRSNFIFSNHAATCRHNLTADRTSQSIFTRG
jgi:hypothetical protein